MDKKLLKVLSWGFLSILLISLGGCHASKNEEKEITVRAGKTDITLFNEEENFTTIMKSFRLEDLEYIKNYESILIIFNAKKPKSINLTEHILNEKGEPKFATSLSSNGRDYNPGATIKGYHLVCDWGEGDFDYYFIIRGDCGLQ
ncbi:MAG: hypothetical protein Q4D32_08395 [Eubacteriales bacterium]|nr:hypothetical protein [Eubacteriales bacterium]